MKASNTNSNKTTTNNEFISKNFFTNNKLSSSSNTNTNRFEKEGNIINLKKSTNNILNKDSKSNLNLFYNRSVKKSSSKKIDSLKKTEIKDNHTISAIENNNINNALTEGNNTYYKSVYNIKNNINSHSNNNSIDFNINSTHYNNTLTYLSPTNKNRNNKSINESTFFNAPLINLREEEENKYNIPLKILEHKSKIRSIQNIIKNETQTELKPKLTQSLDSKKRKGCMFLNKLKNSKTNNDNTNNNRTNYLDILKQNILKNALLQKKSVLKNHLVKNKLIDAILDKDDQRRENAIKKLVVHTKNSAMSINNINRLSNSNKKSNKELKNNDDKNESVSGKNRHIKNESVNVNGIKSGGGLFGDNNKLYVVRRLPYYKTIHNINLFTNNNSNNNNPLQIEKLAINNVNPKSNIAPSPKKSLKPIIKLSNINSIASNQHNFNNDEIVNTRNNNGLSSSPRIKNHLNFSTYSNNNNNHERTNNKKRSSKLSVLNSHLKNLSQNNTLDTHLGIYDDEESEVDESFKIKLSSNLLSNNENNFKFNYVSGTLPINETASERCNSNNESFALNKNDLDNNNGNKGSNGNSMFGNYINNAVNNSSNKKKNEKKMFNSQFNFSVSKLDNDNTINTNNNTINNIKHTDNTIKAIRNNNDSKINSFNNSNISNINKLKSTIVNNNSILGYSHYNSNNKAVLNSSINKMQVLNKNPNYTDIAEKKESTLINNIKSNLAANKSKINNSHKSINNSPSHKSFKTINSIKNIHYNKNMTDNSKTNAIDIKSLPSIANSNINNNSKINIKTGVNNNNNTSIFNMNNNTQRNKDNKPNKNPLSISSDNDDEQKLNTNKNTKLARNNKKDKFEYNKYKYAFQANEIFVEFHLHKKKNKKNNSNNKARNSMFELNENIKSMNKLLLSSMNSEREDNSSGKNRKNNNSNLSNFNNRVIREKNSYESIFSNNSKYNLSNMNIIDYNDHTDKTDQIENRKNNVIKNTGLERVLVNSNNFLNTNTNDTTHSNNSLIKLRKTHVKFKTENLVSHKIGNLKNQYKLYKTKSNKSSLSSNNDCQKDFNISNNSNINRNSNSKNYKDLEQKQSHSSVNLYKMKYNINHYEENNKNSNKINLDQINDNTYDKINSSNTLNTYTSSGRINNKIDNLISINKTNKVNNDLYFDYTKKFSTNSLIDKLSQSNNVPSKQNSLNDSLNNSNSNNNINNIQKQKRQSLFTRTKLRQNTLINKFNNANLKNLNPISSLSIVEECDKTKNHCDNIENNLIETEKDFNLSQRIHTFKEHLKFSIGKKYENPKENEYYKELSEKNKDNEHIGVFVHGKTDKQKIYYSTDKDCYLTKWEMISSITSENAYKFKTYLEEKFSVGLNKNDVFGVNCDQKVFKLKNKMLIDSQSLKIKKNPLFNKITEIVNKNEKTLRSITNKHIHL